MAATVLLGKLFIESRSSEELQIAICWAVKLSNLALKKQTNMKTVQ